MKANQKDKIRVINKSNQTIKKSAQDFSFDVEHSIY